MLLASILDRIKGLESYRSDPNWGLQGPSCLSFLAFHNICQMLGARRAKAALFRYWLLFCLLKL